MTAQLSATVDVADNVVGSDPSFFEPDSIVWKVMLGPYAVPALIAITDLFEAYPPTSIMGAQSVTYEDPIGRTVRSLEYLYMLTFGGQKESQQIVAHVNAMHDTIKCEWNGREHCASEPRNLLWLFAPLMNALCDAYDAYGPAPLTAAERDQFWRESHVIGLANRIPVEMVPTSQAQADEYFAEMRPLLAVTETAAATNRLVFPRLWDSGPVPAPLVPLVRLILECGVALAPDHVLRLYGSSRSPIVRRATIAAYRPLFRAIAATPVLRDALPYALGEPYRGMVRNARAAQKAALRNSVQELGVG